MAGESPDAAESPGAEAAALRPDKEVPRESAESAEGKPPPPEASAAGAEAEEAPAAGGLKFNADAPEFVPRSQQVKDEDPSNLLPRLPETHKQMLRQGYLAPSGEWVAYYVGRLKSFNNRNGYGFLECAQSKLDYGADVFIHKNLVPQPWQLNQPVEFAVSVNNRGQPQARDVCWLPALDPVPKVPSTAAAGGAPGGALGALRSAGAASPQAPEQARSSSNPPLERVGTLKSFSPAQGYGFLIADEPSMGDIFFDRSQLPASGWTPLAGQLASFFVTYNNKGQPQARHVNWDPVPLMVDSPEGQTPGNVRRYTPEVLEKLRKLLSLQHEGSIEKMVTLSINQQNGPPQQSSKGQATDQDVDYASFVLDRLGPQQVETIKDFVKMLMMLMLAKMMRTQVNKGRCQKIVQWFETFADSIDVHGDDVREHVQGVIDQVSSDIKIATRENPHVREAPNLVPTFQRLQAKMQGAGAGPQ